MSVSSIAIKHHEITTAKIGKLNVYVQGKRSPNEEVILTIHDLGCNHHQYRDFLSHPMMAPLVSRSVWVHIDLPGQGDGDPDLPEGYCFPSMQSIADDLIHILDELKIKQTVLFGEGAGANILARFAMLHDERVLGAVLIHLTGSTAGFLESIRDRGIGRKLESVGMNPSAERYLVLHRFGSVADNLPKASGDIQLTKYTVVDMLKEIDTEQDLNNMVASFKQSLKTSINPRNLNKFIKSFMGRTNITDKINSLKCPVMFMTGTLALHCSAVKGVYGALQKSIKNDPSRRGKIDFIQIDNVANILTERPNKVAECLQYFLQGLGFASSVVNRRMSNTVPRLVESDGPGYNRQRSLSMVEYDRPQGIARYLQEKRISGIQSSSVIAE